MKPPIRLRTARTDLLHLARSALLSQCLLETRDQDDVGAEVAPGEEDLLAVDREVVFPDVSTLEAREWFQIAAPERLAPDVPHAVDLANVGEHFTTRHPPEARPSRISEWPIELPDRISSCSRTD